MESQKSFSYSLFLILLCLVAHLFFLSSPLLAKGSVGPHQDSSYHIAIGEVLFLRAPSDAHVRVGSGKVVRAIDHPRGLKIVGLKAGFSVVSVNAQIYKIHVSSLNQKAFLHKLKMTLAKMRGLKLEIEVETIRVTGTLLRFSDWLVLRKLSQTHHAAYEFRARPLADVGQEALDYFKQNLDTSVLRHIHFIADPYLRVYYRGADDFTLKDMQTFFSDFGLKVEQKKLQFAAEPLIRTHLVVAEVTKAWGRSIGLSWPGEVSAQLLPRVSPESDWRLALNALETSGQGQVLASPNLVCRSGAEASFHSGGEFPIRLQSRNQASVSWKEHGVIMKISPVVNQEGSLRINLEAEISMLDAANSVEGIPALKKNRVLSHFDVQGGQTIALSGLTRHDLGRSEQGLPGLSTVPIVGRLFSTQHKMEQQTELVIFVTPEILRPENANEKTGPGGEGKFPSGWVKSVHEL